MGIERRPLKSRGTAWAKKSAQLLARSGITPNQISVLSVVMSTGAFASFYYVKGTPWLYLLAPLFIQLRLACNLFDGMVAVEHQQKSILGDIYNDAPDRIADVLIIMGAAVAVTNSVSAIHIGWAASILAVLTAYVRVLGSSLGTPSFFLGPMAKPHRMALITGASFLQFFSIYYDWNFDILYASLLIILVGSVVTCIRRLSRIKRHLEEKM